MARRLFLQIAGMFLLSTCAWAQAEISGFVKDPSGQSIPKATVTVQNLATNARQVTTTNDAGVYALPVLPPGAYRLTVEASGFERSVIENIPLTVGAKVSQPVTLRLGSTSQSITVDGSGVAINTADASVSTVVDRQFVENIPLNGRSFQSLLTMVPGVSVVPSQGAGSGGEITVNGQRTEANNFMVDGVSANTGAHTTGLGLGSGAGYSGSVPGETVLGTTQSLVSIDALQEFRATTSTYSAEYGRTPGGQFSFNTRSGTNEWHGSAFDYFRNDALDANNYFNEQTQPVTPKQAERQNDFGGTMGGPVLIPRIYNGKDKTFFFFSYEGLRLRSPQPAVRTEVPTVALRQAVTASLQPLLNAFPLPNGPEIGNGLAYFTGGYSAPSSIDTTSIRIDHNFGDKFRLFGRFSDAPSSLQSRSFAGASDAAQVSTQTAGVRTLTIGDHRDIDATDDERFAVQHHLESLRFHRSSRQLWRSDTAVL